MENYYRELVCFLNARLGNRHTAEDLVHDAYLRVLERASQTPIAQPRAFLYRTALNLVIDNHRRNVLRQAEPLEALEGDDGACGSSPHACVDQDQRLGQLQRALAELTPVCRESFMLRKIEGLSHSEIAERLGISRSLVEKHIVNAMKHCRIRLRAWDAS